MKRKIGKYIRYIIPCTGCLLCLVGLVGYLVGLWVSGPDNPREFLKSNLSPQVLSRDGKLLWAGLNSEEQWCLPVQMERVSKDLIQATIALEDNRFWKHHGVDIFAICRAGIQNLRFRRVVSGASTITMQVVKQYYRNDIYSETIWKRIHFKFLQMVQAIRLERYATKEEILQSYLNNVSYGGNLIGVESASYRYFGKKTEVLNLNESALLAGIPKSPERYRPDKNLSLCLQRMRFVLQRMKEEGYINEYRLANARKLRIEVGFNSFPDYCRHWAEQNKSLLNERKVIKTFIDYNIQVQAEELLKKKVLQWSPEIAIASAMVVDVSTGEIIARVGGISKSPRVPVSYLDFCRVPRSPGSALKPFLYCLAMENGHLFPEETLLDSDFDVGNYSPRNFDEMFHGFVDATTALRYSLNIPAVLLLQRVGSDLFVNKLDKCGINFSNSYANVSRAGLGVVLGNCEINLESMMQAYYCLANEGIFRRIKYFDDGETDTTYPVFDSGTVSILYRMMEGKLEGEVVKDANRLSRKPVRICWKTGTSSGRRDAWAFVFNKHYLVGVWMGNPQATGSAKLVGALTAYPTACDIFRLLPEKNTDEFPKFPGENIRQVEVCSLSGLPANSHCKTKKLVYVSVNTPLSRICDVHYYDAQTAQIKERFPSRSKDWDLAKIGSIQRADETKDTKVHLKILSPANNSKFVFSTNPNQNEIQLKSSRDDTHRMYWYVDDRFLGESSTTQPLHWTLTPGKHKIYCLDDSGDDDTIYVEVLTPSELMQVANVEK